LAGIWKDLPRQPRQIAIGTWLLMAALVLLLLEVLERRTGLLARQRRLIQTAAQESARVKKWLFRKRPQTAAEVPDALPQPPEGKRTRLPEPTTESGGLLDALRQARQRTRGN
jgi:hypothetical protein